MADSDKNIIITPFRGATSQPQIKFVGQGNDPLTLRVLDGTTGSGLTAGGAISIEGSAGQLFSVTNRLGTGSIFSVNDISGIPSIDVDASGLIELAPFSGNVGVGYTADPGFKFAVKGGTAYFNNLAIFAAGISAAGGTFSGTQTFINGATFTGNISAPNIVTSFNGLTGAVTGVTTGSANTFGPLQSFTNGISASGATFSGLVSSTVGFSGPGTNLTGNASGLTAGTSSKVIVTSTNSPSTFYPVFAGGAGNTALYADTSIGPLSYVPSTATLKCTNLDLGAGLLTINGLQLTATDYFYFVATNGIYLQDSTLVSLGDVGAAGSKTLLEVVPVASPGNSGYVRILNYDYSIPSIGSDATLLVNRTAPTGPFSPNFPYAIESNHSSGRALKLIYNDTASAATNYVNFDVSSTGTLTISPSSTLTNFVGGISAAGATFSSGINITGNVTATGALIGYQQINAQTGTTYTAVLSDVSKLITLNNASSITMSIPLNSLVAFPIGTVLYFAQLGVGQVGFTGASGVTLNFTPGRFLRTQYSTASATQISANTWLLSGDLSA